MKQKKNFISVGCVYGLLLFWQSLCYWSIFSNLEVIFQMTIVDGVNLVVIFASVTGL